MYSSDTTSYICISTSEKLGVSQRPHPGSVHLGQSTASPCLTREGDRRTEKERERETEQMKDRGKASLDKSWSRFRNSHIN